LITLRMPKTSLSIADKIRLSFIMPRPRKRRVSITTDARRGSDGIRAIAEVQTGFGAIAEVQTGFGAIAEVQTGFGAIKVP
jgi:hypothetical protein